MSQANLAPERQFKGRLARSMLLILLLLSMAPLLLMGGMAYLQARALLRDQVHSLLSAVAGAQAQRIQAQVDTGLLLLSQASAEKDAAAALDALLSNPVRSGSDFTTARLSLLEGLQAINQPSPFYTDFLVILPEGTVQAASNRSWEGRQVNPALLLPDPVVSAVPGGLPDLTSEQLQVIASVPVLDGSGQPQGYLVGVSGSTVLQGVIEKSTFYTQKNYFVTNDGKFIGVSPYGNSIDKLMALQPSATQQQVIQSGLAAGQGVAELVSFGQEPVIAAYTWIPGLGIGWAGEVTQASVYNQINTLLVSGMAIFLVLAVLAALLAGMASGRLAQPIRSLSDTVRLFAAGNWEQRAMIDRRDEIGLLAYSFNQMADELSGLYLSLESQVGSRTQQIQNTSEITRLASSATSLDELLTGLVHLLQERFGFAFVGCSLVDENGEFATLRKVAGINGPQAVPPVETRIRLDDTSLVGRTIYSNHMWVESSPFLEPQGDLPSNVTARAAVPILLGERALGALLIQTTHPGGFPADQIEHLQSLLNGVAPAIQNFFLLEATQVDLEETRLISSVSNQVVQADSEGEVLEILKHALVQTPYSMAFLRPQGNGLRLAAQTRWGQPDSELILLDLQAAERAFGLGGPVVLPDLPSTSHTAGLPVELLDLVVGVGSSAAAFLPVMRAGRLSSLLVLCLPAGSSGAKLSFLPARLRPFQNFAELITTTLEKIQVNQDLRKRLEELQVIAVVSRAVSLETDPEALYQVVYEQIVNALGEVNLSIALLDLDANSVTIPYRIEGSQRVQVEPFSLGEDPISLLISARQPLLLAAGSSVEGTVAQSMKAKSWLGAPMIAGGELTGALVIEDPQQEGRFTSSDVGLVTTLAGQIAAALRNASLLEDSRRQVESERQVSEITSRIRRSPDLHAILETTAVELGRVLGARRAHIVIHPPTAAKKPGTSPATSENTTLA